MELTELLKIRKGIEAYEYEQKVLLRILRKHGELSAPEFDRIFKGCKKRKWPDGTVELCKRKIHFLSKWPDEGTYIIGGFMPTEWSKWLHLTQMMIPLGLVSRRIEDGIAYYSLGDNNGNN